MIGKLNGPKVLAIAVTAFGIIIAVNLTLAFKAVATFPGVEARNSYKVSQEFDATRAAQLALGWQVSAAYEAGVLEIRMVDAAGNPAEVADMTALVGWATSTRDDVTPSFTRMGGTYATPLTLADGNWNIRLAVTAADGTPFRQRIPLFIHNGKG